MSNALKENRAKWTVHTRIEKYNTLEAYEKGEVDEVLNVPGNCLTNAGVNLLWALVAGGYRKGDTITQVAPSSGSDYAHMAFGTNSYIGVGDNNGVTRDPLAGDEGLSANTNKLYMKMDPDYPQAGADQKIVFRSTFKPGTACFSWEEWTVANGNGNPADTAALGQDVIRTIEKDDQPIPNPLPVLGEAYENGIGEAAVTNLNHKSEPMGSKYASATWIVTVELSLS